MLGVATRQCAQCQCSRDAKLCAGCYTPCFHNLLPETRSPSRHLQPSSTAIITKILHAFQHLPRFLRVLPRMLLDSSPQSNLGSESLRKWRTLDQCLSGWPKPDQGMVARGCPCRVIKNRSSRRSSGYSCYRLHRCTQSTMARTPSSHQPVL